jgi:hypothetical protein
MKAATLIGVLLIALGIGALAVGGFTYVTREKVVDVGPIEAVKEERRTVPLPPVLGALSLVGGIALVIAGARRA